MSGRGTRVGLAVWSVLVIAFIVYLLLHLGINALLRIVAHRKTAV